MANQNQNEATSKALDLAGFGVLLGVIFAGQNLIASTFRAVRAGISNGVTRANMWRHHDLVALVAPWLRRGAILNGIAGIIGLVYGAGILISGPAGRSTADLIISLIALGSFAVLSMGLVAYMLRRHLTIDRVSALPQEEYDDLLADFEANYHVQHVEPVAPVRPHGITDAQWRQQLRVFHRTHRVWLRRFRTELRAEVAQRFGVRGLLTFEDVSLVFLSYAIMALLFTAFAGVAYYAGASWVQVAPFKLGAILLMFGSFFTGAVFLLAVGSAAKAVGGLAGGVIKALWDSILTALPNIEGEEAMELWPELNLRTLWRIFRQMVLETPGTFVMAFFALGIVWPDPVHEAVIAIVLVALTSITMVSERTGNDVRARVAFAGRFMSTLVTLGLIYRIAEFLLMPGDVRLSTVIIGVVAGEDILPHRFTDIGEALVTLLAPWWDGLTGMSRADGGWWETAKALCATTGFILIFAPIFLWLFRMQPTSFVGKTLRWTLSSVLGVTLAVVLIGTAAGLAGVNTQIGHAEPADGVSSTHSSSGDADTESLLQQSSGGSESHERVGGSPTTILGSGHAPLSRREQDTGTRPSSLSGGMQTVATALPPLPSAPLPPDPLAEGREISYHPVPAPRPPASAPRSASPLPGTPTCDSLRDEGFTAGFVSNEARHGRCTE